MYAGGRDTISIFEEVISIIIGYIRRGQGGFGGVEKVCFKTSLKGPLKLHDDDGAGSLKAEGRLRLGKPSPLLDPT